MKICVKTAIATAIYLVVFGLVRLLGVWMDVCVEKYGFADGLGERLMVQGGVFLSAALTQILAIALFLTVSIESFRSRHGSMADKVVAFVFSCLYSSVFVYVALRTQTLFSAGNAYWWEGFNGTCVSAIWIVDSASVIALNWLFAVSSPFLLFLMAKLGALMDEAEK